MKKAVRSYLLSRPQADRLAELTGSLLLAAVVCAVINILVMLLAAGSLSNPIHWWQFYTWLTVSSVAGSWLILGVSKFWEGGEGDAIRRRFVMLAIGLGIGLLTYVSADLILRLPWPNRTVQHFSDMYRNGAPLLSAHLCFMAILLVAMRWWKQADPLRSSRLSIWDTMVCAVCAWVIGVIFQFPAWGVAVAVTISLAVQLSAPWLSPKQRNEVRDQFQEV